MSGISSAADCASEVRRDQSVRPTPSKWRNEMFKINFSTLSYVLVLLFAISALPADAQNKGPKAARSTDPALQQILPDKGSILVYTNFFGVNHHGWNHG